jgi:1-phosphofructokinase
MSLVQLNHPPHVATPLLRAVVTLTPAPAIDHVFFVDTLTGGAVHRAHRVRVSLAGKGLNVARDLSAAGGIARAVYPFAAADRATLGPATNEDVSVTVPWRARVNAVIAGRDGTTTNINAIAHALSQDEWARCTAAALRSVLAIGAEWLVIAGTLPKMESGRPIDLLPLLTIAQRRGIAVALDTSGDELGRCLAACAPIELAKPNAVELAQFARRPIRTMGDAIDAARELQRAGVQRVLVSLGADGALLVSRRAVLWAVSPPVAVVNTTGAGDAVLAGFVGSSPGLGVTRAESADALRRAVTWGTLAVQQETAALSSVSDDEGVVVRAPERRYVLRS